MQAKQAERLACRIPDVSWIPQSSHEGDGLTLPHPPNHHGRGHNQGHEHDPQKCRFP